MEVKNIEYESVKIPKPLAEKLKRKAKSNGYKFNDYVIQILREASVDELEVTNLTDNEEKLIRRRLKELGYM